MKILDKNVNALMISNYVFNSGER